MLIGENGNEAIMRISQISSLWSRWFFSKEGNRCFGTAPPKHHSQDFTCLFRLTVKISIIEGGHTKRWTDLTVSASSAMLNPKINSSDTHTQIYNIIKQKITTTLFFFLLYSLLRMMMLSPRKMFRGSWSSVTSKGKAIFFFLLWTIFCTLSAAPPEATLPVSLTLSHWSDP